MPQDDIRFLRFLPLVLVAIIAPSCFLAEQVYTWASVDKSSLSNRIQMLSVAWTSKVRPAYVIYCSRVGRQTKIKNDYKSDRIFQYYQACPAQYWGNRLQTVRKEVQQQTS